MKPDSPYQPVSCELHSQYELAIMHKNKLELSWLCEGKTLTDTMIPTDVFTKNHAEYLMVKAANDKKLCIRLDHIIEMRILR